MESQYPLKMDAQDLKGYTAIVLDHDNMLELLQWVEFDIPLGWNYVGHNMHMTIDPFKINADERIGEMVNLTAFEIGISKTALAVKVEGYDRKTNNAFPHITIAVNVRNGGSPKDSNKITEWKKMSPLTVQGTIQNVTK